MEQCISYSLLIVLLLGPVQKEGKNKWGSRQIAKLPSRTDLLGLDIDFRILFRS